MDSNLSTLTIPVKQAKDWAKEWQTANTNCAKAFLIPASDLIAMLTEMGVVTKDAKTGTLTVGSTVDQGIRAYVGINPDNKKRGMAEGYGNGLFLVGTEDVKGVHKDIVEGNTGVDLSKMVGTGVYDFIRPCPSNCDITSPLYDPK
ncbi:hypothetical protein [Winogradskyella ouciana]|uniref:hypothetical protein n=1 Tax=Winogradskyella ouciana TaxID=2608631 RepID=UPI003D2A11CC